MDEEEKFNILWHILTFVFDCPILSNFDVWVIHCILVLIQENHHINNLILSNDKLLFFFVFAVFIFKIAAVRNGCWRPTVLSQSSTMKLSCGISLLIILSTVFNLSASDTISDTSLSADSEKMRHSRWRSGSPEENFLLVDYLSDGEMEQRISFDGLTAKMTTLGNTRWAIYSTFHGN